MLQIVRLKHANVTREAVRTETRVRFALEKCAQVMAGAVKVAMYEQGTVATGNTAQSVTGFTRSAGEVRVIIGGTKVLHFVRFGRGPGRMPPVWAIRKWVNTKGLVWGEVFQIEADPTSPLGHRTRSYTARLESRGKRPSLLFRDPGTASKKLPWGKRATLKGKLFTLQADTGLVPVKRTDLKDRLDKAEQSRAWQVAMAIKARGTRRWRTLHGGARLAVADPVRTGLVASMPTCIALIRAALNGGRKR